MGVVRALELLSLALSRSLAHKGHRSSSARPSAQKGEQADREVGMKGGDKRRSLQQAEANRRARGIRKKQKNALWTVQRRATERTGKRKTRTRRGEARRDRRGENRRRCTNAGGKRGRL